MKSFWLSRYPDGKELILFFHGWGMEPSTLGHLEDGGMSVLVCYDYQNLDLPNEVIEQFNSDKNIHVISWSLGVWAAARACAQFGVKDGLALNGTLTPVSSDCGIPQEIFNGTLENWFDANVRNNFYRRVGIFTVPDREIEDQHSELSFIGSAQNEPVENIYKKAVISSHDRIFRGRNQLKSWKSYNVESTILSGASHDLFSDIDSWQEVLKWM